MKRFISFMHLVHPSILSIRCFTYNATFAASRAAFATTKPAAGNVPTSTSTFAAAAVAVAENAVHLLLSHLRIRHCQDCRHRYCNSATNSAVSTPVAAVAFAPR